MPARHGTKAKITPEKGYENRKTAESPYINIAIRRGSDAKMIDEIHTRAPFCSRTKLALVAMRLGLAAMSGDDDTLKATLERFGE